MTVQAADVIVINGVTHYMPVTPSITQCECVELTGRDLFCTACWRGYIAHWALVDNKLFLDTVKPALERYPEDVRYGQPYSPFQRIPKEDWFFRIESGVVVAKCVWDNTIEPVCWEFVPASKRDLNWQPIV